jgi:hypothetical protein
MTPAEVDEVNAEIVQRLYEGHDVMRERIRAKLSHLPEDQLAALDAALEREFARAIAPVGKRPGLN